MATGPIGYDSGMVSSMIGARTKSNYSIASEKINHPFVHFPLISCDFTWIESGAIRHCLLLSLHGKYNIQTNLYRRCSAERGYATVSRLSVSLSVMFRYDFHIGWNTLKIIFHDRIA